MISRLSLAEMSVPTHDAASTWRAVDAKNGSLSAAALIPTKATAVVPLSTPRRVSPRP